MKKLLVALLVIFCSLPCLSQTQEPIYVDGVNVYTRPKIYSNCFDGYLNIRSTPSSKGNIIGKFRNGRVPGYAIKQEGNWVKIYYKGVTGYVYKKETSSKPTVEVTVDVDGSWLQGIWQDAENKYFYLLLFDNGTYEYWDIMNREFGTYRLAGKSVVLTPIMSRTLVRTYNGEGGTYSGMIEVDEPIEDPSQSFFIDPESQSLIIDVYNRKIGGMQRKGFGDIGWTREEFFKEKKSTKSILKK